MKVLGLIPARGGSKGLPGKNLKLLCGKSLLQRAFESAVAAGVLDRIILSTDDQSIASHARELGLEVPFLRPPDLAGDASPMIEVAIHALSTLAQNNYMPDALMILQPTSPMRRPEYIRDAVRALRENPDADAVCGVVALPKELCPHYVMKITPDGWLDFFLPEGAQYTRRQDVPPAYSRDGTLYLACTATIMKERSFYGRRCLPLPITPEYSLSIDTPGDWREAERRLAQVPIIAPDASGARITER